MSQTDHVEYLFMDIFYLFCEKSWMLISCMCFGQHVQGGTGHCIKK